MKREIADRNILEHGFVCMQSNDAIEIFKEYLIQNVSVRYTYRDQLLPEMEVKFAKGEIDDEQLRTRIKLPQTGLDVWFSSINMNIAFKEELLRSPKDIEDAEYLRILFEETLDEREIQRIKRLIDRLRR